MSTRALSRWLQDTHNIKLSAVSIAKALRESEKYWEARADSIEQAARAVENVTGVSIWPAAPVRRSLRSGSPKK